MKMKQKKEYNFIIKLAIIECIEATGNIALPFFVKLGHELEEVTQQKCRYFSEYHLQVETGHIQSGLNYEQTDEFLKNLQITEEQNANEIELLWSYSSVPNGINKAR